MLTPRFIAIMQDAPLDPHIFEKNIQKMCKYFACGKEDAWEIRIAYSKHIALAYLGYSFENLRTPLVYEDDLGLYMAMQVPIGIPAYVSQKEMLSGEYLKTVWDILPHNADMARSLAPPQALITLDKEKDTLRIFTDWCGISRLYEQKQNHMHAWTNFVHLLPFITQCPLKPSQEGWASYAACRTFISGTTAYEGIPELRHGSFHYALGQERNIKTVPYMSELFDFTTNVMPSSKDYTHISEGISSWVHDVSFCIDGPLTIDLTGGRDSRIAVAHAIASGIDCSFGTSIPPEHEATIAKQLLACIERKYEHRISKPQNTTNRYPLFPLTDNIIEQYKKILKVEHYNNSNVSSYSFQTRCYKHLSGGTGEFVQANHYNKKHTLVPQGAEKRLQEYLTAFISNNRFVSQYAKDTSLKKITEHTTIAQEHGITDFYLQDYILAYTIHGRLFVLNDTIQQGYSFCTLYDYAKTGFAMPIQDKLDCTFLRNITAQAIPKWKDIPYAHEIATPETNVYFRHLFFWEDAKARENVFTILENAQKYNEYYDIDALLEFAKNPPERNPATISLHTLCNQTALRLCQHIAHDEFLQELNAAALED